MPSFGYGSLKALDNVHPLLVKVMNEAIKTSDFTILQGFRGEAEQNKDFSEGRSQKKWPDSKHNKTPSEAVDCAPYPIDWSKGSEWRFFLMLGHIQSAALRLGILVRFGYDFNNNGKVDGFVDLPHVELVL